jgi:hypothetical protein
MATRGSTNLNRILKVTAHLLFEKGQNVSDVFNLMQGFVDRVMLERWFRAYCSVHGKPSDSNRDYYKHRLPMPPIDWDAVNVEEFEARTQSAQDWF